MTEKRFTVNSVLNFDFDICDYGEPIGSFRDICELLNELDKENRKLKNELNLSKLNLKEKNEGFDKIHKMYMEQIEENKELKQLIKKVMDERVVDYPLLCKFKKMVEE